MSSDEYNFEIDLGNDLDSNSFYNSKNHIQKGSPANSIPENKHTQGINSTNNTNTDYNKSGNIDKSHQNFNNYQNKNYQGNNYHSNFHKNNTTGNFYNQTGYSANKSISATQSILIEHLNWWTNEEDVRNWAVESGQDNYLKVIIFDEHKVNGKSKGYVF